MTKKFEKKFQIFYGLKRIFFSWNVSNFLSTFDAALKGLLFFLSRRIIQNNQVHIIVIIGIVVMKIKIEKYFSICYHISNYYQQIYIISTWTFAFIKIYILF